MNIHKKELPKGYRPSIKDAEWFINNWRTIGKFSAPVDVMHRLCQVTYPNNNNLEEVLLKCAAINSFSSTHVYDLYKMAEHIVGTQIDEKLKNGDSSLVNTIAKIEISGKEHNFYSFATKYCHYHNPESFPIYDNYVAKVLCSFPEDFQVIKENELREYDKFVGVLKDFKQHYGLNLSFFDLDKYLWRLGRWYLNPYEPTPKYYHREGWEAEDCPFSKDDVRSKFWWGEMMFVRQQLSFSKWRQEGKEWLKTANEQIRQLARRYTPEQFGVITYISCLFAKWCPYDDQGWITEY